MFTARARITIEFNKAFKTLHRITLNLNSDEYAIGRASNAEEYGSGEQARVRDIITKEASSDKHNMISVLNSHEELIDIPSVYIHSNKIVFAPYLVNVSRDIGVLRWSENSKKYFFTSSCPRTQIFVNRTNIKKDEKIVLKNLDKIEDGKLVFSITIEC